VAAAAAHLLWWLARRYLPPRDRPLTVDSDAEPGRAVPAATADAVREQLMRHIFGPGLWEKYALIALTSVIFGQMLDVRTDPLQLSLILAVVIVANAVFSTAFARRGFGPRNAFIQFLVTGLLNAGILVVILVGLQLGGDELDFRRLGFMLLLVTLLVTLYDRYRPEYVGRFRPEGRAA
jgi:hypothetical protein